MHNIIARITNYLNESKVLYSSLQIGDQFRIPNDPDNALLKKVSETLYEVIISDLSDTKGMKFKIANDRGGKAPKVIKV